MFTNIIDDGIVQRGYFQLIHTMLRCAETTIKTPKLDSSHLTLDVPIQSLHKLLRNSTNTERNTSGGRFYATW